MAVVFVSPKERQKMFLLGVGIIFVLILAVIFFSVFFSGPKEVPTTMVLNKPKVNIDMKVFDLDAFKDLEPMPEMLTQYAYTATDKNKRTKSGFIEAASIEEAQKFLENMSLNVSDLKEVEIGRENPFTPYY